MQREKLLPAVQGLMEAKNNALISGSVAQLDKLFTGDDTSQRALETEKKNLLARKRGALERKITYTDHSTQIFLDREIRAGNLARVNVTEIITWWLVESGRLSYERQQNYHDLTLEYAGRWLIKDNYYRWEPEVATIPRPLELNHQSGRGYRSIGASVFRGRQYDRDAAVRYAHKWWNGHNPNFRSFSVDCTNYVSQVLYAGGIPMTYTGKPNSGWWYSGNGGPADRWSYSWSVAHSLRWYLASGKGAFRAEAVDSAEQLLPGDVICYDWDGDGVWQHNTVVVGFSAANQPLVNAHTSNSQNRYWDYRDSPAWNEQTKYIFWRIIS